MLSKLMADFTIVSAPYKISFLCPYCHEDVEIRWKDTNPPDNWNDGWDSVICPECGKEIELGDWEYD